MKDIIISEKTGEKKELLVVENAIKLAKVAKILCLTNFNSKYMQVISNIDMDITRNLRLTSVKKY